MKKRKLPRPGPVATAPVRPASVRALLNWFARAARDLPWRRTNDPYAIWVSEIMLQQTQVATVVPYWERWLKEFPTVHSLAAAPEERVLKLWEGLGYYSRARNLQRGARVVVGEFAGSVPTERAALLTLPGVGPYTAGAIASIAFNQPAPIVDGNVVRVLTRVRAWGGDPKAKELNQRIWAEAETLVNAAAALPRTAKTPGARNCSAFNQALMELGATVCTPSNPRCGDCPWRGDCMAFAGNRVAEFPQLAQKATPVRRTVATALLRHRGRWLVQQRPAGGVNAGFWEFPNLEPGGNDTPLAALERELRLPAGLLQPVGQLRHAITRYRITQHLFRGECTRSIPLTGGRWVTVPELEKLALTGPHRRLVKQQFRGQP